MGEIWYELGQVLKDICETHKTGIEITRYRNPDEVM